MLVISGLICEKFMIYHSPLILLCTVQLEQEAKRLPKNLSTGDIRMFEAFMVGYLNGSIPDNRFIN